MKQILVIDDDDQLRSMYQRLLKDNYKVFDAANGKIASEIIQSQLIDLIVVDLFMPEKDGFETIQEVKRKFPNIKILAISGAFEDTLNFLEVAKDLGADDTMSKQADPEMLSKKISELLTTTIQ